MKLVRFSANQFESGVGVVRQDRVIGLTPFAATIGKRIGLPPPADPARMLSWISAGWLEPEALRGIERVVDEVQAGTSCPALSECKLLPPVEQPGQIFALGRNFPAHARESGLEPPPHPVFFGKAPTSLIGHEEPIVYLRGLTRVDPEAELALVLRRGGSRIPRAQALDCVGGYTCFNDVTARDLQTHDMGMAWPWLRSKGVDTFGPIGPWLVTPDEMPDPLAVDVECRVNGELRQKDNTGNLSFDVATIIEYVSGYITLRPGDIISTGTPEGMKPIVPGDVVEVTVGGIGTLRNSVVADEA